MRDGLVGGIDLGKDDERAFEIELTVLVRARMPRGAIEELYAEAFLQVADVLGDRRSGQAQLAARLRETAGFHHLHEGL